MAIKSPKPRKEERVRIMIYFDEAQVNMIQNYLDNRGMRTVQEVIRSVLSNQHKKDFPDYAQPAKYRMEVKKTEAEAKAEIDEMSPADYCTQIIGGKIEGQSCVILARNHHPDNMRRFPLASIKDDHKAKALFFTIHNEELEKVSNVDGQDTKFYRNYYQDLANKWNEIGTK